MPILLPKQTPFISGLKNNSVDGSMSTGPCQSYHEANNEAEVICLYELEFYDPVNTIKVISSQSFNLFILFLGRLSPPTAKEKCHETVMVKVIK